MLRTAHIVFAFFLASACRKDPGPDLQIMGDSYRIRTGDPVPRTSPWFDGTKVSLVAARGETVGILVMHRGGGPVALTFAAIPNTPDIPNIAVRGFNVTPSVATRASTSIYGGGRTGSYPDTLAPTDTPKTDPAYFAIETPRTLAPGMYKGSLSVAGKQVPVELTLAAAVMPDLPIGVWAKLDNFVIDDHRVELQYKDVEACEEMFRHHGVLLAEPAMAVELQAKHFLDRYAGIPLLPVRIAIENDAKDDVPTWIAATQGKGMVPFMITYGEPTPGDRHYVIDWGKAIRAAGGGPGKFLTAVTDEPRQDYGDLVDLYDTLTPHLTDAYLRITHNGAPPRAGSMVLDAETPGTRTWGWIAWRYKIALWSVWNALYWIDRHNDHNRDEMGRPARDRGKVLDATVDATSFDSGDDHGNLDGVLAQHGSGDTPCLPTLRLEALRRGLEDKALLDLASACDAKATTALAAKMVPAALGDVEATARPSWPSDEAAWEDARRQLVTLASSCAK
jgi:hypothetical protein